MCVQPQGNFFLCISWCNLVHSKRKKRLQILILQECCGASVISHLWQAYVNSIQGGENFIGAEKSFQPDFGATPASLKYP